MTMVWNDMVRTFTVDAGFQYIDGPMLIMWAFCGLLFYLAVGKKLQPLLLLPVAFGMLLANLPTRGLYDGGWSSDGLFHPAAGLYYYLSQGIHLQLFPALVFLGIGALTDFGPLIANPRSFLLGGAAQLGIFAAMLCAAASGMFTIGEAASIGVISAANGPASIFTANTLALQLIGPVALAAYAYTSLAGIIQPPIMKALTSDAERRIRMNGSREVGKLERIVFPLAVLALCVLVAPDASALVAMLMLGNVLRESGVAQPLVSSCQNEILSVTTIFLGSAVGITMQAGTFLRPATLAIFALGMVGFACSTASGVLMAKVMNLLSSGNPLNPLIGSAGVSALPGAAQISQDVGAQYDPQNPLLSHAMGPSVAGVIGTALTAGYLMSRLQ